MVMFMLAAFGCILLILPSTTALTAVASTTAANRQTLGLLTFDLDDTLFPTSKVVSDANAVLIEKMQTMGFPTTEKDFLDTTRAVRKTLDSPITYSELRKLAIEREMKRLSDRKSQHKVNIAPELVEECFDLWLLERHRAAERHLFDDAIDMLKAIRQQHVGVCIAAVTNGRGNPLDMTLTLQPHFDFCISGEDDNVFPQRKPFPKIYRKALEQYQRLYSQHHSSSDTVWCHVGDCLANDVGASADCGALAVWYNPPQDEESTALRLIPVETKTPSWSTATKEDLKARAALANKGRQKVSAQISSLTELPCTIESLLASGEWRRLLK